VFLNSNTVKLNNFLPFGNQVEGISYIETIGSKDVLYISNEKLVISVLTFPSKLRELTIDNSTLNTYSIPEEDRIVIHPNPFVNQITLTKNVDKIKIYNSIGNCVLSKNATNFIDTSKLKSGFYMVTVQYDDHLIIKKMIK
jgi:hypothetical protein